MGSSERWIAGALFTVALLAFFFPLTSLELPIVGRIEASGYDFLSKSKQYEDRLGNLNNQASERPSETPLTSEAPRTIRPVPISIVTISLLPIEILGSFGLSAIALLLCIVGRSRGAVKLASTIAGVLGIGSILHIVIADSELHTWFQAQMQADTNAMGDNPFARLAQNTGSLIANAVHFRPGSGLYALAASVSVGALVLHSGLISRGGIEREADQIEEEPHHDAGRRLSAFVVIAVIAVGAAFFVLEAQHTRPVDNSPTVSSVENEVPVSNAPSNDEDGVITVDDTILLSAYQTDEKVATARYENKKVAVTGKLTGVFIPSFDVSMRVAKSGGEADAFVTMGGPNPTSVEETLFIPGIEAYSESSSLFGQQSMNAITDQLRVGDIVTVVCTCKDARRVSDLTINRYNGTLDYSVTLENCILQPIEGATQTQARRETAEPDAGGATPNQSGFSEDDKGTPLTNVTKGQTSAEVVAILGPPVSVTLGAKRVYSYPHLKVVFVDGRVSEILPSSDTNGPDTGNGYGPGSGENTVGGLYHIGGGVSAPVPIFTPEAVYSDEARRAKLNGVCLISLIVDAQGNPQNPRLVRGLGRGLDERALEAVRKYKFKPAMKGDTPVPVMMSIEVNFKLY